ncbi:MAG: hypothetical protein IIA49_16750 [Bacteroidetes bacterium]|nr:hypothetical protein [Bacteroidota bacterium]
MQSKDSMCNIVGGLKSGDRSFHHDPDRYDDEIDNIQDQSGSWFSSNEYRTKCTAAYEGMTLEL